MEYNYTDILTEGRWDFVLPEKYAIDQDGVIYERKYGHHRTTYYTGERPSGILRKVLMYVQEGRCWSCKTPEYDTLKSLHVHRLIKDKPYALWSTILLCSTCHSEEHRRERS